MSWGCPRRGQVYDNKLLSLGNLRISMISTDLGFIIGANKRRGGIWLGVVAVMVAVSAAGFISADGMAVSILVYLGATGIAVLLALYQAYQNGAAALSWLLASSPTLVSSGIQIQQQGSGNYSTLPRLIISTIFFGTVVHLLGTEIAAYQDVAPRSVGKWEQRGLLVVLLVSGGFFVLSYLTYG